MAPPGSDPVSPLTGKRRSWRGTFRPASRETEAAGRALAGGPQQEPSGHGSSTGPKYGNRRAGAPHTSFSARSRNDRSSLA